MKPETISAQVIDDFLQERRKDLAFPPWLEAIYDRDRHERRVKVLRRTTRSVILVYNFFLIGDWLLAPDTLALSAALHFLFVTPWVLFVAYMGLKTPSNHLRQCWRATIPLVITLQLLIVYGASTSVYAPHYLYFVFLTMISANTALRLQYRYAAFCTGAIFVMLAIALTVTPALPSEILAGQFTSYVISAALTLNSARIIERERRRYYLFSLRDKLRAAEHEANANFDPLTSLGNRRLLAEKARDVWRTDSKSANYVAVILFDVDHFKDFNDNYGHAAGDECLRRIADCLNACQGAKRDLAVRLGGEEFLLLVPGCDFGAAIRTAEAVRKVIMALGIPHAGRPEGVVTASFGVSAGLPAAASLEDLISAADVALYAAKRNGRNQVWPPLVEAAPPNSTEAGRTEAGRTEAPENVAPDKTWKVAR